MKTQKGIWLWEWLVNELHVSGDAAHFYFDFFIWLLAAIVWCKYDLDEINSAISLVANIDYYGNIVIFRSSLNLTFIELIICLIADHVKPLALFILYLYSHL